MNGEVGGDGDPGDGGPAVELRVAEERGSGVVEDVKELELLLLDDEEDGIGEFPELELRARRALVSTVLQLACGEGNLT